jgi:hypothetical protein
VWWVLTTIYATHSGILASVRSRRAHARPSPLLPNAPLPRGLRHIRGFGNPLEPRYVLGAGALDQ